MSKLKPFYPVLIALLIVLIWSPLFFMSRPSTKSNNILEFNKNPQIKISSDGFNFMGDFKFPEKLKKRFGNYRKNWHRLTDYEFSGLHWQQMVVIYVNKNPEIYSANYKQFSKFYLSDDEDVDEIEDEPTFENYPEGTIFLKEHYFVKKNMPSDQGTIAIMEKMPVGYDSKNGNWRYSWINSSSGTVLMKGKSGAIGLQKACIECHQNIPDRDYVFSTALRSKYKKLFNVQAK
ncbi:MAG: hypothetical protein COA79_01790 [Planctomycetota bacterium]|nr:MAG: hypothetical protein COA79_01790 [Planctomycetota bacterium]